MEALPASFHAVLHHHSHGLKNSMLWAARKNSYLIVVTAKSAAYLSYRWGIVLPIAYCISTVNTPCCTVYTYPRSGAETHHKTSEQQVRSKGTCHGCITVILWHSYLCSTRAVTVEDYHIFTKRNKNGILLLNSGYVLELHYWIYLYHQYWIMEGDLIELLRTFNVSLN